jgi:hypothetical protein
MASDDLWSNFMARASQFHSITYTVDIGNAIQITVSVDIELVIDKIHVQARYTGLMRFVP